MSETPLPLVPPKVVVRLKPRKRVRVLVTGTVVPGTPPPKSKGEGGAHG